MSESDLYERGENLSRIAIPRREIRQVHEGKGGVTIITTPTGRIPVAETFNQVMNLVDADCAEGDDEE